MKHSNVVPLIESIADRLHRLAGLEPGDPVVPVHLAGRLLGRMNVRTVKGQRCIAQIRDGQLLLRPEVSKAKRDWHTAIALARWTLGSHPPKATVRRVAGAILMPRRMLSTLRSGKSSEVLKARFPFIPAEVVDARCAELEGVQSA